MYVRPKSVAYLADVKFVCRQALQRRPLRAISLVCAEQEAANALFFFGRRFMDICFITT